MSEQKLIVTKDTLISELVEYDESLEEILAGFGLHCFSCPMHTMDTIQDAADVHDLDVELLIEKLNEAIQNVLTPILNTPLAELGGKKDIWQHCTCARNKCDTCWVQKNLWEAMGEK